METIKLSRRCVLQAGACLVCGFPGSGQASTATIHELSDTVYVNKRQIRRNDRILAGDLVSTSANGRIAFSVGGEAYLMKGFTSGIRATGCFLNLVRLTRLIFLYIKCCGGESICGLYPDWL